MPLGGRWFLLDRKSLLSVSIIPMLGISQTLAFLRYPAPPEHGSPGTCPGSSRPAVLGHLHTPGLPVEGHCHLHLTNEYIETQRSQDVLKMCLDLFQMAGHTDTERIVMKEGVYSHSSLETGGTDVM